MVVCDKTISQEKKYNCRMYVKRRNRTELRFWVPFPPTKLKHNDLKYNLGRFYSHIGKVLSLSPDLAAAGIKP